MLIWLRNFALALLIFVGIVLLANASWFAAPPENPTVKLIAHRGVHQTFHRENLQNDTCTAERIDQPTHRFLENTIASSQAAFDYGADVVEFDIHATTDSRLAVFHDWTVDCRTEGSGVTRELSMDQLSQLDIGFGYTADDGQTFPFRGQFVGKMPEFSDMLTQTSGGQFLINFKSNEAREGDMLAERLNERPEWHNRIWSAYGGNAPALRANELIDGLNGYGTKQARNCLLKYVGLGWSGYMPDECRNTKINVPINFTFLMWGWPNRFQKRMTDAGTEIILIGPVDLDALGTTGIDDAATFSQVPDSFDGYVWTNKIEIIGPLVKQGDADN